MLLIFVLVDSSTPNATRIRMYRRNERVCVCARTFREGERVRKRDKERDCVRARDNIMLERKAVEEGQRERESEPPRGPRVLKCRALLCISRKICSYVRANCAKGSVSLFFFTRLVPFSSSLSRPLSPSNSVCFSIFAIAAPSVQLPLAFSRCSQYLSLSLFLRSFARVPWERERERGDTGEHLPTIYFLYWISALSKWLSLVTSERKCSRYADRDSSLIYGALCPRCNLLELSITRVRVQCMYYVEATNDFHWNFVSRGGWNCRDGKGERGIGEGGGWEWRSWRKKWIQFEEKRFDVALNDVLLWKFFFSSPFFFFFFFFLLPSLPLACVALPDRSSRNAISLVQRLSFGENEDVVKHLGMIYLSLDHDAPGSTNVPPFFYLFSLSLVSVEKKFM